MAKFIIQGKQKLRGQVTVQGAKNAATPCLAASLLCNGQVVLENVPNISDVERMKYILESLGTVLSADHRAHRVTIDSKKIKNLPLNSSEISAMRSSVLLVGPLLARFGQVCIIHPGGCHIGARPLDNHWDAFRSLGASVKKQGQNYILEAKKLSGADIVLDEFSVTATENAIMAACLAEGKSTIQLAACEPHVQNLIDFLNAAGSRIKWQDAHTLSINGVKSLHGSRHKIIPDMIEAGTLIIASLATDGQVKIKNVIPSHLTIFIKKLREMGVKIIVGKNWIETFPSSKLKSIKIQTLPYPGFPTDLQAPFSVLLAQAFGKSLIHDPMYEGRLNYLTELAKMGARVKILDPHRAEITGPANLRGAHIQSLDLRAGATLILAALSAQGESVIGNIEQIDRGYEKIDEKLKSLGAEIQRVE